MFSLPPAFKHLTWFGVFFGVCVLFCCFGLVFFFYRNNDFSTDNEPAVLPDEHLGSFPIVLSGSKSCTNDQVSFSYTVS